VPDLPIGYIGLSLGPQDPRGAPTNCGTHRVNGQYMIILIKLSKIYVLKLLPTIFGFIQLSWW